MEFLCTSVVGIVLHAGSCRKSGCQKVFPERYIQRSFVRSTIPVQRTIVLLTPLHDIRQMLRRYSYRQHIRNDIYEPYCGSVASPVWRVWNRMRCWWDTQSAHRGCTVPWTRVTTLTRPTVAFAFCISAVGVFTVADGGHKTGGFILHHRHDRYCSLLQLKLRNTTQTPINATKRFYREERVIYIFMRFLQKNSSYCKIFA
jgi:hypothetical protein